MLIKEELATQLYEKFLHETYSLRGNFCEDEISTLYLKTLASNYTQRCSKEIVCPEPFYTNQCN